MIQIKNTKGDTLLIKYEDIMNIWEVKEKNLRVINFMQDDEMKEVWTNESLEELAEKVTTEIVNNSPNQG